MNDADMKDRLKELYLPPAKEFVLVDVPDMRYVMIDGHGALRRGGGWSGNERDRTAAAAKRIDLIGGGTDRSALDHAVQWLFTVIHPIKRIARERMGKNFVEPPLEGLWWADDMKDFVCGNRVKLNWRMMIVFEPDWLTAEMFRDGVAAAKARLGKAPAGLRLESYHEGPSVQIMYVGPPSEEGPTIARLHKEFLPVHNLIPNGHHHEIYLTDPNRTAPEKMRTVLRQPVRHWK